jgi:hypothetical protein
MAKRAKPRRITPSPEQRKMLEQVEQVKETLSKTARAPKEPGLQVVLVPSEELSDRFESWLVLHVPDGKDPLEIKLGKDSYSRDEAIAHLIEVFTAIGEKRAVGEPPDPTEIVRLSSALVDWRTASSGKSE